MGGDSKSSTQASSSAMMDVHHKKNKQSSSLDNLTEELLSEILIRLPSSKEAIRCKLVCKRWSSLISSDHFVATSLINHHNSNVKSLTLVLQYGYYAECIEFLPGTYQGLSRRVDLKFLCADQPDVYFIMLEQSCGDLVLCSGRNRECPNMDYYIFNILTKQWIALPPTPLGRANAVDCAGFLIEPNCVDRARFEYLVLRFIPLGNSRFDIKMFSSEQGIWTELDVTSPRNLNRLNQKISLIACGRMFYTLDYGNNSLLVNCILAIDPFTNDPAQVLRIIDLPLEARNIDGGRWKLGVCRGSLRVANVRFLPASNGRAESTCPSISIWQLEDYRMGRWTLVYNRKPKITGLRQPTVLPHDTISVAVALAFHPIDEDLVCFVVGYYMVLYNIRTDKVESSTLSSLIKGLDFKTFIASRYGSIVLPITQKWWPTPLIRQSL